MDLLVTAICSFFVGLIVAIVAIFYLAWRTRPY